MRIDSRKGKSCSGESEVKVMVEVELDNDTANMDTLDVPEINVPDSDLSEEDEGG